MARKFFLSMFLILACSPAALAECRPGEDAWTDSGMKVRIQAVFPNGQVSVVYNTVNFTFDRSQLATRGCNRDLCSGQGAVTNSGMNVVVNGVFPNGDFSVAYNTVNFTFDRSEVATRGCLGNLCSGDLVLSRSGMKAQVNGFFNDNRTVSVVFNTVNFTFDYDDLAKTWQ